MRARIEEEDFALLCKVFLLNKIDEAALIPGDDMVGVDFYCVVKDSGLCYNGSGLCYYGMVSDLIASVSVDLIHRDVDKDSWEFCISYLSDTIPHPQACGNVRESIHIYYGTVCSWAPCHKVPSAPRHGILSHFLRRRTNESNQTTNIHMACSTELMHAPA